MIVLFSALFGALLGTRTAIRRKGGRLDILQYGFIYGLAFAMLGLFLTIFIHRLSI